MIKYEIEGEKVKIEAKGSTKTLATDVLCLVAEVYKGITNKHNRKAFRECMATEINDVNSPIWETEEDKAVKIVGVDIEGLKKQLEELRNEGR